MRKRKPPGRAGQRRRVRIAAVSRAFPGKTHDKKIYDRTGVVCPPGVRLLSVDHQGNSTESPEEADAIAAAVTGLLGASWTDEHGTRALTASDVLVLALPLALVALLVKLTSRGPVFYRQERMGLDGKSFTIVKFRSMLDDAERDTGPVWAVAADPRVTEIGRFLRRSNLDELPQLWNVLRGEMSLVGPRPERPEFAREFARRWAGYNDRLAVRAGITGLAQTEGWRGDSSIGERLACDLRYVAEWSLVGDLVLLLRTVPEALLQRRVGLTRCLARSAWAPRRRGWSAAP